MCFRYVVQNRNILLSFFNSEKGLKQVHADMIKAICQIMAKEFYCLLFKGDTCTNYIKAQ